MNLRFKLSNGLVSRITIDLKYFLTTAKLQSTARTNRYFCLHLILTLCQWGSLVRKVLSSGSENPHACNWKLRAKLTDEERLQLLAARWWLVTVKSVIWWNRKAMRTACRLSWFAVYVGFPYSSASLLVMCTSTAYRQRHQQPLHRRNANRSDSDRENFFIPRLRLLTQP